MIKKKDLVENEVFSIKLEGIGYTLAQLRDDNCLEVFDTICEADNKWQGVDLNKSSSLFCIVVATSRILKLFHRCVTNEVVPNTKPRVLLGLTFSEIIRSNNLPAFDLIEYEQVFNPNTKKILIENLNPEEHLDILYSYEDIGMHGKPDDIRQRLIRYHTEGVNWDPQIQVLYPEIAPPPPHYKRIKYNK